MNEKIKLLKKAINYPILTLDIILKWTFGEDLYGISINDIYHHTEISSDNNKFVFTVMEERKGDIESYYWDLSIENLDDQNEEIINWLFGLILKLSPITMPIKPNKLYYFETNQLPEEAFEEWKGYVDHNNGYAIKWNVLEPEKSETPEIEKFFISKGVKVGEKVILHSVW